jgi:subtilisin family serine protease
MKGQLVRRNRTAARRAVVATTAAVMALTGLVVPATPVAAAPDDVVQVPGIGGREWTVTLVTGDTVRLTDNGGGRFSAVADPQTRPDGQLPIINIQSSPEEILAIPSDAQAAVDADILDESLFDVKYLALNGYADDAAKQVPLIVQYDGAARASAFRTAEALPASDATIPLSSVDGAAMKVDKQHAEQFWAAVRTGASVNRTGQPTALAGGIGKVWLDRKVTATLAESVPLIGAPAAWQAGLDGTGSTVAVLDTGIDATHPDVAGKIAASKSFIAGEEVADGHGHGTHVAATVAGSGAASNGRHKGVAPGASLVIGKVLNNAGSGSDSEVIGGMEWAARDMGVDVVSMSLGAGPTDGTDPLSQAVENLTASTGALFVVAAGNSGPGRATVSAPATAPSALTVAATSKTDGLADFSSRGPRLDGVLKPDISAPGVDIVAARAAGTDMGTPVDDRYTSASGTSMATPHIAGAAAILAQAHPDWTWDRLKAALMSTTKDTGHTVYETGAGRVDVARAVSQKVVATTANVDFGAMREDELTPASKEVTYANTGDTDVTLALTTTLRNAESIEGALTAPASVTVPAGGTATVTLSLDPTGFTKGYYSGGLVATDEAGGIRISTPVGLNVAVKRFALTVTHIGFDGKPVPTQTPEVLWGQLLSTLTPVDIPDSYRVEDMRWVAPGTTQYLVEPGTYGLTDTLTETNQRTAKMDIVSMVNPQIEITEDTEITFDLRSAVPVKFNTPKPMADDANTARAVVSMRSAWNGILAGVNTVGRWSGETWVTPTQKVTKGKYLYNAQLSAHSRQVAMRVVSPERFTLDPFQYAIGDDGITLPYNGMPMFAEGTQRRELVYVDSATKEDIAAVDLRGKIAVQRLDPFNPEVGCWILDERMQWLKDAGAVGVLMYQDVPWPGCYEWQYHDEKDAVVALPHARVTIAEGNRIAALLAKGPVRLEVTGNPDLDYTYQLSEYVAQRIPGSMTYDYGARDLAEVDARFPAATRTAEGEYWHVWHPGENFSASDVMAFATSTSRTEYFGGLADEVKWSGELWDAGTHKWASFPSPTETTWRWGATPISPGAIALPPISTPFWFTTCANCRLGDVFAPLYHMVGSDGITDNGPGWINLGARLFRDGVEIPKATLPGVPEEYPVFTLPKEKGTYTLTQTHDKTSSKWTFQSGTVTEHTAPRYGEYCPPMLFGQPGETDSPCAPQPLVYVAYDLGDQQDLTNKVAAGGRRTIDVTAYHAQSTTRMPAIDGLTLSYSTDDGATWKTARIKATKSRGGFQATIDIPVLARTKGTVSLKVKAWDVDGNKLEQTTTNAITLK